MTFLSTPLATLANFAMRRLGPWTHGIPDPCGDDVFVLRSVDDEVTLRGPLDVNIAVLAQNMLVAGESAVEEQHHAVMSYDVSIPAGRTWTYRVPEALTLLGSAANGGLCIRIRRTRPRPPDLTQRPDLPCDFATVHNPHAGRFFPEACEPCGDRPVRLPPTCPPAISVPTARGGCVRPHFFDGMFVTSEDLETQLRYVRVKNQLQNRAMGQGVVWGLDVKLDGGKIRVAPGYGVDCCGHDLTVTCEYVVDARRLLLDPAVCPTLGSEKTCKHVLLEYVECPESPRPVHGGACRDEAESCEMSRIRETVRLRLVPPRDISPPCPLTEAVDALLRVRDEFRAPFELERSFGEIGRIRTTVTAPAPLIVPWSVDIAFGAATQSVQPDTSAPRTVVLPHDHVVETGMRFTLAPLPGWDLVDVEVESDGQEVAEFGLSEPAVFTRPIPSLLILEDPPHQEMLTIRWRATGTGEVFGTTQVAIRTRAKHRRGDSRGVLDDDRVHVENVSVNVLGFTVGVGHPVLVHAGGVEAIGTVETVQPNTFSVVLAAPFPGNASVVNISAVGGGEALVGVRPTVVGSVDQPTPGLMPCCGPSCCEGEDDGDPRANLYLLTLALAYGRLVQALAAQREGGRILGAGMAARARLAVARIARLFRARTFEQARRLEQVVADLYEAWCRGAIYPGPQCTHDPDGVVIGCAEVTAGEICAIDPLGGRRWVLHPPLLQHWARQFCLGAVDEAVMKLFSRLCCISHLPGFGALFETSEQLAGEVIHVAGAAPIDATRFTTSIAGTVPGIAGAVADPMALLRTLECMGLHCLVGRVEDLLCTPVSAPEPSAPGGITAPIGRVVAVATAIDNLDANMQPTRLYRNVVASTASLVLSTIPLEEIVPADNLLAEPLERAEIRLVSDLLDLPVEEVHDAILRGENAAALEAAVADAERLTARVTRAVARATAEAREEELANPGDIERPDARSAYGERVVGAIRRARIPVRLDALRRILRIGRQID